jgi:surface polysaccharide O-acyltransferase-like enzyme
LFFILGYLLPADKRFTQAVRRDWPIMRTIGILAVLAAAAISFATGEFDVEAAPRTPLDFVWWALYTACGWCLTAFMLFVGMRFLNFSNKALQYGQEALLPFFVVHQPVIVVLAYFVVQWDAGILPKLLVLVVGAFVVSLGLYELLIRRVSLLRVLFGMKATVTPPASPAQEVMPGTARGA